LLRSFGRPGVIADVVRRECTRKVGAPGEERLAQWFETTGGNQFNELRTPLLPVFDDALKQVESGEDPQATTGLGDAAISWILKNLQRLRTPDGRSLALGSNEVAMILTEDGPYDGPVLMQRRAHVLSTRQWLKTLERLGVIPSYQAVIDEIRSGGRLVPKYMADRPAELAKGIRSDWKDGTEATAREGTEGSKPDPEDGEDGSGGGASGGPASRWK
jgi:hypothetical protein